MFNDLLNEFLSLIPGREWTKERKQMTFFLRIQMKTYFFLFPFRQREKKINYFKFVGFFFVSQKFCVFFFSFFVFV
jgi:hypothetical protein